VYISTIFTKFGMGRNSQVRTLTLNFTAVVLKMQIYSPKIGIFGTNVPQRGISSSDFFTQFSMGKEVSGPHPHAKFYRCGFKSVGLWPPKSLKNANFWYKFAPEDNVVKLEYRCTPRKLPLCHGTIIVLKIPCLIAFLL